jgi:hypothetical protein
MKHARSQYLALMLAPCLLAIISGCALFGNKAETFDARPIHINFDLRYVTLHTDEEFYPALGTRYEVHREHDGQEMADVIITSANRTILMADLLWSGWEPHMKTNELVVLSIKRTP